MTEQPWGDLIGKTMGDNDRDFARHDDDEDRAFDLLKKLRAEKVGLNEVRDAYEQKLRAEGCKPSVIDNALRRVDEHFRPWLRD